MTDPINPSHYQAGGIETIDILKAKLTSEEFKGFLLGNALKYLTRARLKNGLEDIAKARWYLDRFLKEYGYDEYIAKLEAEFKYAQVDPETIDDVLKPKETYVDHFFTSSQPQA